MELTAENGGGIFRIALRSGACSMVKSDVPAQGQAPASMMRARPAEVSRSYNQSRYRQRQRVGHGPAPESQER
jgi:hypothetical protein